MTPGRIGAYVADVSPDEALLFLHAEISLLESVDEPMSPVAAHAMAARLKIVTASLGSPRELTSPTHGVDSEDTMQAHPPALGAIAKTKSDSPILRKLLDAGWSVRQLTKSLNAKEISISHAYLGRMLKGEVDMRTDIKRAIREITKVRI